MPSCILCFTSEDTQQRAAAAPTANEAIYKVLLLIATLPRGRIFGKLTPLGEEDQLVFVEVSCQNNTCRKLPAATATSQPFSIHLQILIDTKSIMAGPEKSFIKSERSLFDAY